jgi:hypothetical protein
MTLSYPFHYVLYYPVILCYILWRDSPHPPLDQSLFIIEASTSPSDTPQSVGLLWTSDQLVAETSG